MAKKLSASSSSKARGLRLFGAPPLLAGEDAAGYDELLARISSAVKPSDVIEEIWVRDIVDLTWEIFRWRRLKTGILAMAQSPVHSFIYSFEKIATLDRLTTIAGAGRNAVLREIDRRRAAFAQTLRSGIRDAEDAEFQTIEPTTTPNTAVANNVA
jgi:hypothetical protein